MAVPRHTFITAESLASRLGDARLRIFDCRFDLARPDAGRVAYTAGHLPDAQYADLNLELSATVNSTTGRHPLPAPLEFESTLRRWGVHGDSTVVAYDDRNGAMAARLWWMLRWVGHDDVCVLDGGYARWTALGLPAESGSARIRPRGNFVARPNAGMTVSAADITGAAGATKGRLLDARAPERFRGDAEPIDAVAGHVPGAVNQPYTELLAADGRVLASDELRRKLATALGNVPPERAVAMCGSGVTACHLLLALEHAGLIGAKLYPGSWSEWIRDPSRPIARGAR